MTCETSFTASLGRRDGQTSAQSETGLRPTVLRPTPRNQHTSSILKKLTSSQFLRTCPSRHIALVVAVGHVASQIDWIQKLTSSQFFLKSSTQIHGSPVNIDYKSISPQPPGWRQRNNSETLGHAGGFVILEFKKLCTPAFRKERASRFSEFALIYSP